MTAVKSRFWKAQKAKEKREGEDKIELTDLITEIEHPKNQEQLIQAELRRRLNGETLSLEQSLTSGYYDFHTIISRHGIPTLDISGLKEWLAANRSQTFEAIERLYRIKDIQNYALRYFSLYDQFERYLRDVPEEKELS